MPTELINRNIFTSLALTVSYLNRIYMPTLSLRFEMQLDLKMIVGRSYDDRKLYLDDISKDFNIENKILSYAMGFFESKDIDLGIMLSNSQSFSGLASTGCFSPFGSARTNAYALNSYQRMASQNTTALVLTTRILTKL